MTEFRTDQDLLRDYTERGSDHAFQALVRRHVDLVFATAFRRLGDPGSAQEVTQDVFLALARKAVWLRGRATLVGWLHQTTLFAARQWWRGELRRQRREQIAIELGTTMKDDPGLLRSLTAVLDEGLLELRNADRQVLMLRYFEDRSHREVGALLGVSEDAVRKRIDKALDTLTGFFRRRGYAVPTVATTAAALRAATQAAPAGLAAVAANVALSGGGAASITGLALGLAKLMGFMKTQTAVVALAVAILPVSYQWHALRKAKSEQNRLSAELTELRQGINSRERAVNALERKERYRQEFIADLQRSPSTGAANGVTPADAASLYHWDEQSDYVRLPKSLASHLTFSEFEAQPRGKASPERVQRPTVAKDGTPSPVLLDALGLTVEEAQQVGDFTRNAFAEFAALVSGHSYLTNQSDLTRSNGEYYTWITPALPEEGARLRQSYSNSLVRLVGEERTEAFWQHAQNSFREFLNEFGQAPKTVSVTPSSGSGGVEIIQNFFRPDGTVRATWFGAKSEDVPEALKPYVEALKKSVEPQMRAIPP